MKEDSPKSCCRLCAAICMMCAMAFVVVSQVSCGSAKDAYELSYTEARNYYFRNDATPPNNPLLTTQDDFDALFGCAAVMGKDGAPTRIDFDRQSAIAVVLPETDVSTIIKLGALVRHGDTLTLKYAVEQGQKMSYTIQPMAIAITERQPASSRVVLSRE